ncbi:MAG: hypothetical protein K8H88_07870, partial [Sandaracinaceae bacterium]|nr:hypothetical protein [Sandaracinaceae bacterium]
MDLSSEELDVLDRVLSATASLGAGPRLEAVTLLQSAAGRSLCRKVLDLRRGSAPVRARVPAASAPVRAASTPAI